jgi:hypothetical protein
LRSGDQDRAVVVDAILAGATEYDGDDIAKAIERQPSFSYVDRMAVFSPTGRPVPSRELFTNTELRR